MVDWINISSNSGSGNATITVTASSYSQLLERSTALTVRTATKSAVVGITQRYNSSFTVSPATISAIPYSGASYSITITANDAWSATTIPAWCSLSVSAGTSGTSIITLTVSSNSGSARNDTLVFTCNGLSRSVEVSQAANEEQPHTITITPATASVPSSGGSFTISVVSDGVWNLSAPDWVSLSTSGGSGNATVTVTIGPNTNEYNKIGTIIGQVFGDYATCSITQEGYYIPGSGGIVPSTLNYPFYETSTTVYITSNVAWHLSADQQQPHYIFISPSSGMSGTSIPVTITLSPNNSSANTRTSTLYLQDENTREVLDTATITQASRGEIQFSISNNHIWSGPSGGTYYIPYSSNVPIFIDTENYRGNWSFTVENNRIVATCAANNTCDGTSTALWVCARIGEGYSEIVGALYLVQDPPCVTRSSGTNVYNITTTSSPTELMQIDLAYLRWVKIDGSYIPLSSLICEPYENFANYAPPSLATTFGKTEVWPHLKYTFSSTGYHTVSFACVYYAPQYQPRLENARYVNDIPLVSMEYTTNDEFPYVTNELAYAPGNPKLSLGIQSLTSITFNLIATWCENCEGYSYNRYPQDWFDLFGYNYTYNLHVEWSREIVYYDTFENTYATDLWFDGYTAPTWRDTSLDPPQQFIGLAPTGTAHAIAGSDYSGIASHLPSGWTLVYDA